MMRIVALMEELQELLIGAGCETMRESWAQLEPATDADLAALSEAAGAPLMPELEAWFRQVRCVFPLIGSYETLSASQVAESLRGMAQIDFSAHLRNIKSWNDGRFEGGELMETYWQPAWVPIAQDGCGNAYCVDLKPGARGRAGQLIAMEFQDGQGPYLASWPSLEAMLEAHVAQLRQGRYQVDEEGFLEYEY